MLGSRITLPSNSLLYSDTTKECVGAPLGRSGHTERENSGEHILSFQVRVMMTKKCKLMYLMHFTICDTLSL